MPAGNATTPTKIDQSAFAQAVYLGDVYATIKRYLIQWQQNAPDNATMTALGYTDAANQAQIEQHISNLLTLMQVFEGTQASANSHAMINDIAKLRGVDG